MISIVGRIKFISRAKVPQSDICMIDAGPVDGCWLFDDLVKAHPPKTHPERVVAFLCEEVVVEVATNDRIHFLIQVVSQDLCKVPEAFHVCWIRWSVNVDEVEVPEGHFQSLENVMVHSLNLHI